MPVDAVRFPVSLARTALDVHLLGDHLQVGRIDAPAIAAQVVDHQSIRYRAVVELPRHPMGVHEVMTTVASPHLTVANDTVRGPLPALTRIAHGHLRPEAIG